ncbi:penicillin-binding transpeptidase domain-containing protein [Streptomyces somaliensis DSM 40738]|uniref:Penicillin-binding protein 2 n=1 Tax=Streptomyces somaliensis (strain ATCC 33201 / DSM 40738 / JCM 12659 / KCTC 9044 / NCTC 11332 / NRRL B-12077 / IP 733) TaxID=1134445 RepID=A0AA44IED6_STRE0|nr:penicillin-binding transpeptidase domain-containing protein [Streptomyces somaliensis]MCQ0023700.1 penicillin-binding transpeptidase domain-containing protein [Streptomyces somaliensis DSM 40738]NKY15654.1 penicillin-binding protein 2 [Streptomyces somaliensis DSM 40738]
MTRHIRRAAALCLVLLAALLVNAARVQVLQADRFDGNPANRRAVLSRYAEPRGDILVEGRPVTGSQDTGELLRYERTYTEGPLYAPVTGHVSQTYGTTLVEEAEDAVLSGTSARLPPWSGRGPGRRGGHVATTVRSALQRAAYGGLAGRRGAVVALEPSSGRILALVSSPSYDPGLLSGTGSEVATAWARLNTAPGRPMLNRALRETYPPGSAFKIVTAAAALDARVVTDVHAPSGTPDPYRLPGTGTVLPNEAKGCDDASLAYALRWSCNTVLARLGVEVGLPRMLRTARAFGFNDPDLRVPSRVARSNFDTEMSPDRLALSAIGQYDTRATPLQMAMVAAAVANDGELARPHLVESTTTADGGLVGRTPRSTYARAMTPPTARLLREMMVDVVEGGSGSKAAVEGAEVGGKTGTAQHGVGNQGTPYAWFIGWARAADAARPGVAVAVVVEDAEARREEISGGGSAAPIARAVMEVALAPERDG